MSPLTIIKPTKESRIYKTIQSLKSFNRKILNNNYLLFILLVLAFIGELIGEVSIGWYSVIIVFILSNLIRDLSVIFKKKK